MTTTKERPILFSGPMVRAILAGRKTQTRRVVKPQPTCEQLRHGCVGGQGFGFISDTDKCPDGDSKVFKCPYGQPGDRLWVRETWLELRANHWHEHGGRDKLIELNGKPKRNAIEYRADSTESAESERWRKELAYYWRPSIHMPRWASRITLRITGVRVERLQEISEEDAEAEGCGVVGQAIIRSEEFKASMPGATYQFAQLWESINGRGSWGENPWVWVIEFEQVKE